MKFIGLWLVAFLVTQPVVAQVMKYRVFEAAVFNTDEQQEELEWREADILLVLDVDGWRLRIFSKEEQDIDLLSGEIKEVKDGVVGTYTGVDQEGRKLAVKIKMFTSSLDTHVATAILEYSDISLAYRLKKRR